MNDEKPRLKTTWKQITSIGIGFVLGLGIMLWRDYEEKGYLNKDDLVDKILPIGTLIVVVFVIAYWAQRPERNR